MLSPRLLLLKADALGPGERWVTVHPNGPDSKGTPILIQEHPDGSASVIGGAGGKLNHLKLRGVKSAGSYAAEAAESKKARTAAQKAATARDKELGVYAAKQERRAALRAAMAQHRAEFVKAVAALAGWDQQSLEFDHEAHAGLSVAAQAKAKIAHERDLFRRAKDVVNLNRRRLVEDADARQASGLGAVPAESPDPERLAAQDLDPMPEKVAGLGFMPDYKGRAEAAGLSQADLEHEVATLESGGTKAQPTPGAREVTSEAIAAELKAFAAANPETPKPPNPALVEEAHKAADLVRALKRLRVAEQKAREASAELDAKPYVEPKAFVLEVSPAEVDEAARKEVEDDVRTAGARAFLSEVGKMGGEESLGGHIGAGAFNSLNAAAQTVGGDALIDRSVVDVLGIAGAAAVLARRFHGDLGAEADNVRAALEDHHIARSSELQATTLAEAGKLHDAAKAIELPDAENGADLVVAQEVNERRRQCVTEAKRLVGHALGEMQASAALVAAMQGKAPESFEVSLGRMRPADAIVRLRALGLKQGDYKIEDSGAGLIATLNGAGLDRLAKPVDVAGMRQIRRNLDIIDGKFDEDGWLPHGFASRPDLAMKVEPGVAPRLAKPFAPEPDGDLQQAVRDYIGGRTADGDPPADILADLQSQPFFEKAGNAEAYRAALDAVTPLTGPDGKMLPIEKLAPSFEDMADAFVAKHYGSERSPLHRQNFPVDDVSVDALHRALAAVPEGVQAMKPVAELAASDRHALRRWWYANVAKEDPATLEARDALDAHAKQEPVKESLDMFGESAVTPEWQQWSQERDALAAKVGKGSLDWPKYVKLMGSPERALATTQDLIRSQLVDAFAGAYNRLRPGVPLKTGKVVVSGNLDHLDAVDPAARDERLRKHAELVDSLRNRSAGKYAGGSVSEKLSGAAQAQAAMEQAQMGFFSSEEAPAGTLQHATLGPDERHTLGHAAEQKLAGMMSVVGQNFKPGQPTKLWQASMSGGKNFARQRLLKLLVANKRVMAAFGTGSGKSALQLGGFTHLHALGKVKKGVIIAPSPVVGQFGGEALRYLQPGKYKWHADPGASREQRIAAYKDPETHFSVVTHQAFRDDMIHLGAQHAGIEPAAMAEKLNAMSDGDRAAWAKGVMEKEGFAFDYMSTDESQYTLNREGKENSRLANVVDAFSHHAEYYMPSSGDPVKNDASEVFDVLRKLDPARYKDRTAFMRSYGGDTVAAQAGLKREMARYFYPSKIDPDVQADRKVLNVPLSGEQQAALNGLHRNLAKLRVARMGGKVDVAAAQAVSPSSFKDVPPEQHEKVAHALQEALGMVKSAAVRRVINSHPTSAKFDAVVKFASERKGKPGVVFAHNHESVEGLRKRLEAEGHRVVTLTGLDSTEEKDAKRRAFQPEAGSPSADILIASDAAATGLNLQRGQWLMQYDTPDTAMVHGQRQGRIFRTGQKNNVELADLVADHPSERKARDRLQKKYGLRNLMTSSLEGLDDTGLAYFLKQRSVHQQIEQGALV